jgi:hypothetical protein
MQHKKPFSLILRGEEEQDTKKEEQTHHQHNPLFERKIQISTEGLLPACSEGLYKLPQENALSVANYIISMKTEINLSDNYRRDNINVLCRLSQYSNHKKSFKDMTREDILAFLYSFRKTEASDPLHKWIGTYNLFRAYMIRFFKWLYYPDAEPDKRPKPEVVENIPQLTAWQN